jgi:hypothetical protein
MSESRVSRIEVAVILHWIAIKLICGHVVRHRLAVLQR